MTLVRRLAVPAGLTCAVVLVPTGVAAAEEPERTGWWHRLSAGPLVAPAPMSSPDDLRVASGVNGPAAYSALLYPTPGSTSATLDLKVRAGSRFGTPEVVACPTVTTDWPEGGNQPYDRAPEFDCDAGSAFGSLAADGSTMSFVLDSSTQLEPGVWSLALVPQPDSTSGLFSIDFEKPAAEAFAAEAEAESGSTLESGPSGPDGSGSGSGSSGEAFAPTFAAPPAFDETGGTGTAEVAPLVAGGDDAALPQAAGPQPAVAGTPPGRTPVVLARPAGVVEDLGTGRRLLGLLVLAGGSAAVGYAAGQQRPGPRLIGGRARALPATAAAVPAAPVEERPRGIGRFARVRDAAPRRLR